MTPNPEFPDQPILRDRLALDRTKLANERTLLAYLRTALVLVLSGVTLVKLLPKDPGMIALAFVLLVIGIATGTVGGVRCYTTARRMREWECRLDAASNTGPPDEQS